MHKQTYPHENIFNIQFMHLISEHICFSYKKAYFLTENIVNSQYIFIEALSYFIYYHKSRKMVGAEYLK